MTCSKTFFETAENGVFTPNNYDLFTFSRTNFWSTLFPLSMRAKIYNNKIRPPTNDRTCMGWHTRHASTHVGAGGAFTLQDAKPNGLDSCSALMDVRV
jgi:hypothetical protein